MNVPQEGARMPNDPMQLLLGEHEVISRAKEVIDAMDQVWTSSEDAYQEALREVISFFVKYGDGFHHQKEEMALFPVLRNHPDFYAQDMLEELQDHHQTFRDHIAKMQLALTEKKYEVAQSRLRVYFNELLDHIAVENDELFVMAGSLLSETELERMYFRFKDIDRELGEDLKKKLEETLTRVKALL
jgi:hemerythrin-like domain-containing protein